MKVIKNFFFCILPFFVVLLLCPYRVEATPLLDYGDLISATEEGNLIAEMNRISENINISVGAVLYDEPIPASSVLSYVKQNVGPAEFGSNRIVLCVDLKGRDMAIEVSGRGNSSLDDWDLNVILDEVAPYFTQGNYAKGIAVYLDLTEDMVLGIETEAEKAKIQEEFMAKFGSVMLGAFVISLIIASIVVFCMVSSMNNVKEQHNASSYLKSGSFQIQRDRSTFLYRTVTKTARQQNTGGGSGGGGGRGSHSGGQSRGF